MKAKFRVGQMVRVFELPMTVSAKGRVLEIEQGEDDFCYVVKTYDGSGFGQARRTNPAGFGEDSVSAI